MISHFWLCGRNINEEGKKKRTLQPSSQTDLFLSSDLLPLNCYPWSVLERRPKVKAQRLSELFQLPVRLFPLFDSVIKSSGYMYDNEM